LDFAICLLANVVIVLSLSLTWGVDVLQEDEDLED
jgi:hypothetical protein